MGPAFDRAADGSIRPKSRRRSVLLQGQDSVQLGARSPEPHRVLTDLFEGTVQLLRQVVQALSLLGGQLERRSSQT